jgi:uncharacterized protein (DUF2342 family)
VSDAAHPGERAPLVDERVALWAASLVAPSRRNDPVAVARLRAEVADDLPRIDAAARRWTELGADLPPVEARVIGRLSWVRTNLASMRGAFDPLRDRLPGDRRLASRLLGVQLGALFGLLSTKVLGQFVLPLGGPGGGQLLVVGPNVLELGDQHGELATDIRRTVVLHEVTHRLQFDGEPVARRPPPRADRPVPRGRAGRPGGGARARPRLPGASSPRSSAPAPSSRSSTPC